MTVADMWGRVQGTDVVPLTHEGEDWFFPVPEGIVGQVVCEFWAQDEAGNVGYRAALLTIAGGSVKCWRWLDSGCESTMLAIAKPSLSSVDIRTAPEMVMPSVTLVGLTERPVLTVQPHVCPLIGGI